MSPPVTQRDENEAMYTLFGAFSPFIVGILLYTATEVLDMKSQHYFLTLILVTIMGVSFSFCLIRTGQVREVSHMR